MVLSPSKIFTAHFGLLRYIAWLLTLQDATFTQYLSLVHGMIYVIWYDMLWCDMIRDDTRRYDKCHTILCHNTSSDICKTYVNIFYVQISPHIHVVLLDRNFVIWISCWDLPVQMVECWEVFGVWLWQFICRSCIWSRRGFSHHDTKC